MKPVSYTHLDVYKRQDTKSDSDMVESKMQETVAVSEKGRKDMERVGEALSNIEVSIHNLEEAVNKVGTASGEIVQIIKLIGDKMCIRDRTISWMN